MVELVGFAFVDDADIMVTADGSHGVTLPQEATSHMQASADTWVGGLHASGGTIVVDKSHWTLVDFAWDKQGNPHYWLKDETSECPWSQPMVIVCSEFTSLPMVRTLRKCNSKRTRLALGSRTCVLPIYQSTLLGRTSVQSSTPKFATQ
jgi:hypothetical protein